ncbi:MAG: osmotically inducible protein OsmC [Terrimonas sp.]|nr:osmotically inducible protein OsmC [Terrimonas sp.]
MTKTVTTWLGDHRFEGNHDGNRILIDGDKKNGHGPKALLLSSLAGCSGVDIVDILTKMRVSFSQFSMEVEADQTTEFPKVFTDILITYKMKADAADEAKIRKAIDLSMEKYCGVTAMLRKNSAINYKLELL